MKRNLSKKAIWMAVGALVLGATYLLILFLVIIPANRYSSAKNSIEEGDYVSAYENLVTLGGEDGYKDSWTLAKSIYLEYWLQRRETIQVGDVVYFGVYDQKAVDWRVLDKKDNAVLLVSEHILSYGSYDSEKRTEWASSDIRARLNNSYFNNMFRDGEKEAVLDTVLDPEGVVDKVFF